MPLALRCSVAVLGSFSMPQKVSIVVGLILLCFPLWLARVRGARLSGFDQRAWPKGRNLLLAVLDTFRASAAAWILVNVFRELPPNDALGRWFEPALMAGAVAIGLVIQTLAWLDEDYVLAPVPFLVGVLAVVAHPIVLVIVLPLWIGSSLAVRSWASGFIAGGMGVAGVGLAVSQQEDWRLTVLIGLTFFVPVLTSVMAGRHLGWPKK